MKTVLSHLHQSEAGRKRTRSLVRTMRLVEARRHPLARKPLVATRHPLARRPLPARRRVKATRRRMQARRRHPRPHFLCLQESRSMRRTAFLLLSCRPGQQIFTRTIIGMKSVIPQSWKGAVPWLLVPSGARAVPWLILTPK